jgi:integrase/recombinase XerD
MTPIEIDARDYLEWMEIHNYAKTTIACRGRYLDYFMAFAHIRQFDEAKEIRLELLLAYQRRLFSYRKNNGLPLSFGTQAQRLIPVAQFFAWLRRVNHNRKRPREMVENGSTSVLGS